MACRARVKAVLGVPSVLSGAGQQHTMMWPWGSHSWLLLPPQWCWTWDGDHEWKVAGAGRVQFLSPAWGGEQWQDPQGAALVRWGVKLGARRRWGSWHAPCSRHGCQRSLL